MTEEHLTERQHEVYRCIVGIVLDDMEPTLAEIARRMKMSGASEAQKHCNILYRSGWLTDDRKPIDGPGAIVRDIGEWMAKNPTSRILPPELWDRLRELVTG